MNAIERTSELDKIGTQFDQFIIAVNGALIAYAFKQVDDRALTLDLIPLGFAVLFWGFSFYCGITSIRKLISVRALDIFRSTSYIFKEQQLYAEIARDKFNEVGEKANLYNKRMFVFLYLGGCFYILWQIIEMYLRTKYS